MSCYVRGGGLASALAKRRSLPWLAFLDGIVELARTCRRRREQRRELLEYLALDHRAAADIGITGQEARNWAERPFWRD